MILGNRKCPIVTAMRVPLGIISRIDKQINQRTQPCCDTRYALYNITLFTLLALLVQTSSVLYFSKPGSGHCEFGPSRWTPLSATLDNDGKRDRVEHAKLVAPRPHRCCCCCCCCCHRCSQFQTLDCQQKAWLCQPVLSTKRAGPFSTLQLFKALHLWI